MIHIIVFELSFAACLAYALTYGGRPERTSVTALAAANLLSIAAINSLPRAAGFGSLAEALALVDFLLLVCLVWIALVANRLWTIALAGLQLSLILVHVSKALYPALPAASYGIFAQFWAWPMIGAAAIGTRNHRKRIRELGEERDWKPLWPRLVPAGSPI
jgi:hypothetical protein